MGKRFHSKFVQTDRRKMVKQYAPNLSIREHKNIFIYYIPVTFLAQIQASHGEIQQDGKKNSIPIHSEIQFQIWYDDVSHKRTTFQILFLHNIVKIMKQEASA